MSTSDPVVPPPDDKDWTWTLERTCPECGFEASGVAVEDVPGLTRRFAAALVSALGDGEPTDRPAPATWSPLEYACHVRDVCVRFDERLGLMLAEDDPVFANWDQDEAALTGRYWDQDVVAAATELAAAADTVATHFATVEGDEWRRPGRRSNGSSFTIGSLARYFLHDLAHHAWDVSAR